MSSPAVQWKSPWHYIASKWKWFDSSTSLPVCCNYSSLGVEVIWGYCCQNCRGGTISPFNGEADKVWLCMGLSQECASVWSLWKESKSICVPDGEFMLPLWSLLGNWQRLCSLPLSSLWPPIFLRLWEFNVRESFVCALELVRTCSWLEELLGRVIKTDSMIASFISSVITKTSISRQKGQALIQERTTFKITHLVVTL